MSQRFDRRIIATEQLLSSYEKTRDFVNLNEVETTAFNQRLAEDYFWKLGYPLCSVSGNIQSARDCYKKNEVCELQRR